MTTHVENTGTVRCQSFAGGRCNICGGYFADADDICANGHEIGALYWATAVKPEELPQLPIQAPAPKQSDTVVCAAEGCRCNICHTYFADGDDICQRGHEIGHTYIRSR